MGELYLYESEEPISVIPLSTSGGAALNAYLHLFHCDIIKTIVIVFVV
jgi:hypothetical protein